MCMWKERIGGFGEAQPDVDELIGLVVKESGVKKKNSKEKAASNTREILALYLLILGEARFAGMVTSLIANLNREDECYGVFASDPGKVDASLKLTSVCREDYPVKLSGLRRPWDCRDLHNEQTRQEQSGEMFFGQSLASGLPRFLVEAAIMNGDLNVGGELRVLDLCSAPGNKSLNLMCMPGKHDEVSLLMNDVNARRIGVLRNRLNGLGFQGGDENLMRVYGDKKIQLRLSQNNAVNQEVIGGQMDMFWECKKPQVVVADVPCNGGGRVFRHPRSGVMGLSDSVRDVKEELEIAKTGLSCLETGGVMVFSTCTPDPYANEYVVSRLLNDGKCRLLRVVNQDGEYLLPGVVGIDDSEFREFHDSVYRCCPNTMQIGFFAALFQKVK